MRRTRPRAANSVSLRATPPLDLHWVKDDGFGPCRAIATSMAVQPGFRATASSRASSAVSERRVDHAEIDGRFFFFEEPELFASRLSRFWYQFGPPPFLVALLAEELEEPLLGFFPVEEDSVVPGESVELHSCAVNVIEFKTSVTTALNTASTEFFDERRPDFLAAPFAFFVYMIAIGCLPFAHLPGQTLLVGGGPSTLLLKDCGAIAFAPEPLVFALAYTQRFFGLLNAHSDAHAQENRFRQRFGA